MRNLLLYCAELAEEEKLTGLLARIGEQIEVPLHIQVCRTRREFLHRGRAGCRQILLYASRGPDSVTLAAQIHEECPENWLVWFCDLDFSLFAYHMEIAYFGLIPVCEKQVADALKSCESFTWERAPARRGKGPPKAGQPAQTGTA